VNHLIVIALSVIVASSAVASAIREPVMIALPNKIDTFALESNATGFFMNDGGDVLTERHMIEACKSLLNN